MKRNTYFQSNITKKINTLKRKDVGVLSAFVPKILKLWLQPIKVKFQLLMSFYSPYQGMQ